MAPALAGPKRAVIATAIYDIGNGEAGDPGDDKYTNAYATVSCQQAASSDSGGKVAVATRASQEQD